ncbi:recombinase family protein [Lentzea sp. BCCO 10_0856]|uniref:Recombinase family protein n=1 Tax=Lentzea miocenica TaxID=3095431 RepID=A0ABU4SWJ0_9PSEU|nr:recombinase family protein [Lentzea sp. BCCO 10_0856]MDX8030288.1 recombinase family protein [Lentzea sp. BCCO 10_0856]
MTVEISPNPWATLDELLGVEVVDARRDDVGPVAFYGRCSTEDNQDPETSHAWQFGNAQKFVEPLGGVLIDEFFDIGQSRSVPWERRPRAARLLESLKDPNRTWTALVVGEGTRCWFGNQFSLIAPRFEAYGVDLWVPELGGKYDPRNPSHKMLMSVLGGMSESERQHVQARVRAAMDAQVVNEGRHQGGRAPYGYTVVDGGPHPNPRKAAEGYRLRILAVDDETAPVVRRIFADYLTGELGDRAIAARLNRDGVPCPSAHRPEQNRHRPGDGWQGSTVRAILDNPRYTGYAVFGRWRKFETLLDFDDVAAGHVVKFRRSTPDQVVRSRVPAHPDLVTVEDFTQSQLLRRSRAAGGMRGRAKLERTRVRGTRPYIFRGLVRCGICSRRMQAATIRKSHTYYRCHARTLAPGSHALSEHPPTVNLAEEVVLEPLNKWLCQIFNRQSIDRTVAGMVASQDDPSGRSSREVVKKRLADAEAKLRRFQAAIAAGVDPVALVDAINETEEQRAAASAELNGLPAPNLASAAELQAAVDSLADVTAVIKEGEPEKLARLYGELGIELKYDKAKEAVYATTSPRVLSGCVRGGT